MPSRKSFKQTLSDNRQAMRHLAIMSGKPVPSEYLEPEPDQPKPRKPSTAVAVPTEHVEQVAFVKWFRMQYRGVRIFAVPNAAARSVELASYLRSEGMTKGVADLWIPAWKMAIEMKRVKGSVTSPEQLDWAAYLADIGWIHIFGYGFEDARSKVLEAARNL